MLCFACGEPGHKDYQCPKEKLQVFTANVSGYGKKRGEKHTRKHACTLVYRDVDFGTSLCLNPVFACSSTSTAVQCPRSSA